MPPRSAPGRQATQQQNDEGAVLPNDRVKYADYVGFTVAQAVISEGCLLEAEVKAMIRRLAQRNSDDAFWPVLKKIQQDIGFLEMSIERIKFPLTKEWYICLVNKEMDESSKLMGSKYGAEQNQYFRTVVEALCQVTPPQGGLLAKVNEITLKNLDVQRDASQSQGGTQAAKARKLTLVDKETALRAFARDGWLHQPQQGYYTLGPRSLGELKDWVVSLVSAEVAEKLLADYM